MGYGVLPRLILTVCLLALVPAALRAGDLPDRAVTPGVTNPDVRQGNIRQTICSKGWTASIRPPEIYTRVLKRSQLAPWERLQDYEEDHLIPLSLGGHPTNPANLWAQPRSGVWNAARKNRLALKLQGLVCRRQMPLKRAQAEIAADWIAAYRKHCPTDADCPPYKGTAGSAER